MWGGRFSSTPSALMEAINASIGFDKRLAAQDIQGSIAHSAMLARQGIITEEDRVAIHSGLQRVLGEIDEIAEATLRSISLETMLKPTRDR